MLNGLPLALIVGLTVLGTSSIARANPHAQVSLVSESNQPRAGSSFLIGIRIVPALGWHSYWSNPGDSGIPPRIQWKAVPGLHFGPLQHPAPTLLKVSGVTSYVHAGEHFLLAQVRADATLKRGTLLPIEATMFWATCSESLCVPERTMLSLNLRVGDGAASSSTDGLRLAAARLPRQLAGGVFRTSGGIVRMEVPRGAQIAPARATFFPNQNGMIAASGMHARVVQGKTEIVGHTLGNTPSRMGGVIADGQRSYAVSFRKVK